MYLRDFIKIITKRVLHLTNFLNKSIHFFYLIFFYYLCKAVSATWTNVVVLRWLAFCTSMRTYVYICCVTTALYSKTVFLIVLQYSWVAGVCFTESTTQNIPDFTDSIKLWTNWPYYGYLAILIYCTVTQSEENNEIKSKKIIARISSQ